MVKCVAGIKECIHYKLIISRKNGDITGVCDFRYKERQRKAELKNIQDISIRTNRRNENG